MSSYNSLLCMLILQEQSQANLRPRLGVAWLEKKYNVKTKKQFYRGTNSSFEGKCCTNDQVKKIVGVMENTDLNPEEKDTKYEALGEKISLVHVYFKELEVVKYSKQENYGIMDLIGKTTFLKKYRLFVPYSFSNVIFSNSRKIK